MQQALLLSGDVRVHTRRDNIARLDEMRAAEAEARKARKGLWALPQFAVRKAADVARSEADIAADPACAEELATHAETDKPTAGVEKAALEKDSAKSADDRPQRPRRKREFLIVEGRVTDIAARERAVFLNFGADISRDFAVLVPKEAADAWPGGAGALDALKGRSVRVRGDTPRCARPLMRIDHAAQIEVLDGPTAPTSTAPTAKAP